MTNFSKTNYSPKSPVFVHIAKNAGTSLLKANPALSHVGHLSLHGFVGNSIILCIIRNPVERLLSAINYAKQTRSSYHETGTSSEHPDFKLCNKSSVSKIAFFACLNALTLPILHKRPIHLIRKLGIKVPLLQHPGFHSQMSRLECENELPVIAINCSRINDAIVDLKDEHIVSLNKIKNLNKSKPYTRTLPFLLKILVMICYYKDWRMWVQLKNRSFTTTTTLKKENPHPSLLLGTPSGPFHVTFNNWWSNGKDKSSLAVFYFLRLCSPKSFLKINSIFGEEILENVKKSDVVISFENMVYNKPELLPEIEVSKAVKLGYISNPAIGNWVFRNAQIFDETTTTRNIQQKFQHFFDAIEASQNQINYDSREFCALVARHDNLNGSNQSNAKGMRTKAFQILSEINHIDSSGHLLRNSIKLQKEYNNNIHDYYKNFRFVIAFENSITSEYLTEKIWDALMAGCIPIYLGATLPSEVFTGSGIIHFDPQHPETVLDAVKELEENRDYREKFRENPIFQSTAAMYMTNQVLAALGECRSAISSK